MVNITEHNPTSKWECVQKDGYKIYQSGSHLKGNFIRVFAPDNPYRDSQGKIRGIAYLHGFALSMPRFYEDHLELLAKRYYVFFPDFQKSDYPSDLGMERQMMFKPEKNNFRLWLSVASKAVTNPPTKSDELQPARFLSQPPEKLREMPTIQGSLGEPSRFKYLRVSSALVVIIAILNVISWFRRNYGKNLINLLSTVGWSLLYKPSEWMENAIAMTEQAWQKLCTDDPDLAQEYMDFYVFGHSLGGLLALSWPAYITENQQKFFPKQILTADPAPSTEMGIPQIAIWILRLFNCPFVEEPIKIQETGAKLKIPVGIMHGADDRLVRPQAWIKPRLFQTKTNFDYIASKQKQIYFSLSNEENKPPLIAFHNQAVTDTTFFDDALFKNFGGVKKDPNAYNGEYIWPGLNLVVEEEVKADKLLDKFPLEKIQVQTTLPKQPPNIKLIAIALLGVVALLGLGYWFWQSGTI